MKLIVGIGNPGSEYENTRHNVGFMIVDQIASYHKTEINKSKFKALYTQINIDGERVILMKPQTYVNLSGTAVISFMNYFKIDKEDVLIIYDDLDLPTGKIRVRAKGSAGGHNGMKSIIEYTKGPDVKRVRVGIDKSDMIDSVDYVLGRFSTEELNILDKTRIKTQTMAEDFVRNNFSDFMNKYNRN